VTSTVPALGPALGPGRLYRRQPGLFHTIILSFLTTDPVPTVAPIRRARR
jgi:hypothetical protein